MKFSALICIFTVAVSFPNFDLDSFVAKYSFNVSFSRGNDASNDGSELKPWKTLDYALWNVPKAGGAEIFVADGEYRGAVVTYRGPKFETNVLVRAETPYHVQLVDPNQHWVLYLSNATNIIFHGFEMYGTERGVKDYIVQIENCSNIILENCIIHDSFRQVILKINEHSSHTVVRGCIFYNQPNGLGGAHLVEANIVYNLIIEDCIFFNNYEASNRIDAVATSKNASSFLAVKATTEQPEYSDNQIIRRNVFLNWVGDEDRSFIELGGDGQRHKEVGNTLIENNLFINNNISRMSGLISIKGNVEDVYISSNTATGHIQHSATSPAGYVVTVGREGYAFRNRNIRIINNIFSDPTVENMGNLFTGVEGEDNDLTHENKTQGWLHNLCFNGGKSTNSASTAFAPEDPVNLDPLLETDFTKVRTPHFVRSNHTFFNGTAESGFLSIEDARQGLVTLFAIPHLNGDETLSILNAGRTAFLPFVDILGNPRAASPGSIGAYEVYVKPEEVVEEDDTAGVVEDYSESKQFKDGITVIIVVIVVVVVLSIAAIVATIIILQIRRKNKKKDITLYLNSSHVSV